MKSAKMLKKVFIITLGIFLGILFLIGCGNGFGVGDEPSNNDGKSKLFINFDSSSLPNRTIVPGISMDVTSYDVSGVGPNNSTFSVLDHPVGTSLAVSSLATGNWVITVDAKNLDGTVIGDGENNVYVPDGGSTNITVVVTPLIGTGGLNLALDWSGATQFTEALNITATLTKSGESPVNIDFTKNGTAASHDSVQDTGYYDLAIHGQEGELDWYFYSALRIVYNQTTSATINVAQTAGGLVITIELNMQNPIQITFAGPDLIEFGTDGTITSTTVPSAVDSYQWYCDGQLLSGETGASIIIGSSLEIGEHMLTLRVALGAIISSENYIFNILDSSQNKDIDDFEAVSIGDSDGVNYIDGGFYAYGFGVMSGETAILNSNAVVSDGADSTLHAYEVACTLTGDGTSDGGAACIIEETAGGYEDASFYDLSDYIGIKFYAKGTGVDNFSVEISTTDIQSNPAWKDDTFLTQTSLSLSSDWQEYVIPWTTFEAWNWSGHDQTFDPAKINKIKFKILTHSAEPVEATFAIDEVEAY